MRRDKRMIRASILLIAVLFAVGKLPEANADAPRPNVILLMADDQGAGDAGYQGHPTLKTPHLDQMAAAGLTFSRFYSGSPVCSPTRGSALTGRHPERYGITHANKGHMQPEEVTLAEVLKKQGYATGHFGKWHLGTLTKTVKDANRGGPNGAAHYAPPWENGFDVCFSTESKVPTWDPLIRGGKGKQWWDPVVDGDNHPAYGTHYWNQQGEIVQGDLRGDDSRLIMNHALEFIEKSVSDDEPFLAVIWFHAPHLPVVAGKKYTDMYPDEDKHTQHYYGCITALDEQVGRLRAALRESEIERETILFYCSDNGPEGGSRSPGKTPLRGRKRDVYEGGVRVPGIVEWSGRIESGATSAMPASTLDYLPTILEVLELPIAEAVPPTHELDGVSLWPTIQGDANQRDKPIPLLLQGREALIDNRYKLVRYPRGSDQLFDIVNDPREESNLAKTEAKRTAAMRAEYDRWRASAQASARGEDYVKSSANKK